MSLFSGYHCQVIVSQSYDPFTNLALEKLLFDQLKQDQYILLLWRSFPALILGRFQNPWVEINTLAATKDQIQIVRRMSGGGCVYHDLGNLNYCFLSYGPQWERQKHCEIILNALKPYGISGRVTDKFDILVEHPDGEKKVSGSAFKQSRQKHLHHGTLLIDADLEKLRRYLKPIEKKIVSKSIASRPHSVCNLNELSSELDVLKVQRAIIAEFANLAGKNIHLQYFGPEKQSELSVAKQHFEDALWLWGETPFFEQTIAFHFDWGEGEFIIKSQKAQLLQVALKCDFFHPAIFNEIQSELCGKQYHPTSIKNYFSRLSQEHIQYRSELLQLADYLMENVT